MSDEPDAVTIDILMSEAGFAQLQSDEGFRSKLYNDKTGQPFNFIGGNLTIGYGLNLSAGISQKEAMLLCMCRVETAEQIIEGHGYALAEWSDVVRDVVTMIQYNTGNVLGWPDLLTAAETGKPASVIAAAVRDSTPWRTPGGEHDRYERMAAAIENGHW